MEIQNLENIGIERILDAFEAAFADYAVAFDRQQLKTMFERRGFCPRLSFAAFEGDTIAAFTLNGLGMHQGMLSCYDCATGTLPAWRGRGLAAQVFEHSVPRMRDSGVGQYVLEVLQSNESAIALYRKQGFEITAACDCFSGVVADLRFKDSDGSVHIRRVSVGEFLNLPSFADFEPSWQNSDASLLRGAASLLFYVACEGDGVVGCCAVDPVSGDIARIAVRSDCRRRGIASALLAEALRAVQSPSVKVLNVHSSCTTLPAFLAAAGFRPGLSQYVMRKRI